MDLISKLNKIAPTNERIVGLRLTVEGKWPSCRIEYAFQTISAPKIGNIHGGFLENYSSCLRASVDARNYFNAIGIDTRVIDTRMAVINPINWK